MNRDKFYDIYNCKLTPKQKTVLLSFLAGKTKESILEKLQSEHSSKATHKSTITNHLKNICIQFDINPVLDTDYYYSLIELFRTYKPDAVSDKLLENMGFIANKLHVPGNPEPYGSKYYVSYPSLEIACEKFISSPGNLIRIKAPRKMGKTSLINRLIAKAKQKQYKVVYLKFSLIGKNKFNSTEVFLKSFFKYILQKLLPTIPPLQNNFNQELDINDCTEYFQDLLSNLGEVLVLIIDEIDQVFEYPQIYHDFFPMLRDWSEKTQGEELWENLRLIIAYSTEDYGRLGINRSPFNIGYEIKLEKFNQEQIKELAKSHQLNFTQISPIIDLVDGHPYLVRLAFYHLYGQSINSEVIHQLIAQASTDVGIYRDHLQSLLEILQSNLELKAVFQKILQNPTPIKLTNKTFQVYQLESMGLIKLEGNQASISCPLYRLYFSERLN